MLEWENMTTRERDATVIREVLGWPIFSSYRAFTERTEDIFPCVIMGSEGAGARRFYVFPESDDHSDPFSPSTSIADAWVVVEHCTVLGHEPCIEHDMEIWRCAMYIGNRAIYGNARTAPEAICKAALAVIRRV